MGNAPTPRAKLLHKLKETGPVSLGKAAAKLPVAGDPSLTLLTPKPKHAWELGRGTKVTPSPNQPINLEAPTRRAPSYSIHTLSS